MNYEELGFKCGIEIHQQLDTKRKLFCQCKTDNVNVKADKTVVRKLRPVAGEKGAVDDAAKFEFLKAKSFEYNIYEDLSCLVELDEEPPHSVNNEALNTVLQFAMMLDCEIPDEIRFMRKLVLDGSNPSGFQRTAIIGFDGVLETELGEVQIPDIELEEESAGKHGEKGEKVVYDLDRLGIPLIEIGTDASIKSPEHAKQVAEKIGMYLRSTRNVKRGLGTIRQDVNVSIEEGARVEIKGFQDVRNLDKLVEKEVSRQKSLVDLIEELEEKEELFENSFEDVTEIFESCGNQIIGAVVSNGGKVFGCKAPLEGLMNQELCEGQTLGSELAGYARAQGLNGMMHTDEDVSKYGLKEEFQKVSEELGKEDGETVIIVAGDKEKAENAIKAVLQRVSLLFEKVPEETRGANDDFTTDYSRPLPGAARMYPETDVRPITVDRKRLKELKESIPKTLDKIQEELSERIGEQLALQITYSEWLESYEKLVEEKDFDERFVANFFVNTVKDTESRYGLNIGEEDFNRIKDVIGAYFGGEVSKDSLGVLLKESVVKKDKSISSIIEEKGLAKVSGDKVRDVVKKVLSDKKELIDQKGEHARGALMGLVMKELGDGAEGGEVNKVLSEELSKVL